MRATPWVTLRVTELQAAARRLVVEEDAGDGEQVVALAVFHRDVVGEDLGDAVGAARIEPRSVCGVSRTLPNISLDDAGRRGSTCRPAESPPGRA